MADDHSGPIDAPGNPAAGAHQGLGLVLGAKIRQIQPFGFIEHALRAAAEAARDRNGRRTGGSGRLWIACEINRMAGSLTSGAHQISVRGAQIVQGAEMEGTLDAAGHGAALGCRCAEQGLRQIAVDGHEEFAAGTASCTNRSNSAIPA